MVVSHHVPTFLQYPPKYKKSELSQGFAVELHDLIEDSNVSNWLYGHHHFNTPDFMLGKTTMRTNQLGYTRQHEHGSYKKNAVFEM
jgi:predicted phosphohydrolase